MADSNAFPDHMSEKESLTEAEGEEGAGQGGVQPLKALLPPVALEPDLPDFTKGGWGVRHTVVGLASLGVIVLSMMRYNLAIAIVSMVGGRPGHGGGEAGNSSDVCPAPSSPYHPALNGTAETTEGLDWDERTQGVILGAFFYGNIMTNVVGGRMAERVGSKPVILLGMLLSSFLSLVSPPAANLPTEVFIAVRLILGIAQGVVMPAIALCLVTWVPPLKRGKYSTIVFSGSEMGAIVSLSVGGWLCGQSFLGGWPAVFYLFGAAGLLWCLVWFIVIQESPEKHSKISLAEKKYLMTHCAPKRTKVDVPWRQVFTSLPFWAIAVMHFGHNWGYYTFAADLPTYLSNIQHFSIKSNGAMSALPYITKVGFAVVFSLVMDRAAAAGRLSVRSVRRLSMVVASYLPALGLVAMCLVGCSPVAAVVVLSVAVGLTGSSFCGLFSSHQDISPSLAGTLYGFTNTLANTSGFLVPGVVGIITFENQTISAWNTVFLLSAAIYIVTGTFYITFVSDQVQPFNSPQGVDDAESPS